MVLTPQDIHDQQFATVRMRVGYDMDEVDAFLDVVETEITRLLAENDDLRAQLAQAQSRPDQPRAEAARPEPARTETPTVIRTAERTPPPAPPRAADRVAPPEPAREPAAPAGNVVVPSRPPEPEPAKPVEAAAPSAPAASTGSPAVAEQSLKMLELAQRTADETVAAAKKEAADIVARAKAEAAEVTTELEGKRTSLEKQVGELRTFERQYRTRLRDHIAGQLLELDQRVPVDDTMGATPSMGSRGSQAALEAPAAVAAAGAAVGGAPEAPAGSDDAGALPAPAQAGFEEVDAEVAEIIDPR